MNTDADTVIDRNHELIELAMSVRLSCRETMAANKSIRDNASATRQQAMVKLKQSRAAREYYAWRTPRWPG